MQNCISHHNVTCTVLLYTVLYCITLMHIFDIFYANITTVILFTWTLPQMCIPSAKNVSICTIIPIYASENTVKQSLQDNEMVEMLTKNYFRGNKEGTSSCVLRLVCFGMSRVSSDRSDLYYSMGTVPPYGHTQWLLTLRQNISVW